MKQPRHQDYDKTLERICSYPAMVEDLMRTFAPGLAGRLDCSTLRKDSVNWVSAGRDAEAVGGGSDAAPDAQAASAEVMALWQRLGPDGAGLDVHKRQRPASVRVCEQDRDAPRWTRMLKKSPRMPEPTPYA